MNLIDEHCAHLVRLGRRPSSIDARRWALRRFETSVAPMPVMEVGIEQLRDFTGRPGGPAIRAAEVSHLRGFYRWAVSEDLRVDDPTVRLERPSVARGRPRPMPTGSVEYAINRARLPVRAIVQLAAYAGLRACEIAPLRGEDLRDGWVEIHVQKGGHPGRARINPPLLPLIAELPKYGYLFPKQRGDGPVSAGRISHLANTWLHAHEIDHTLHTLRHWYGTNLRKISGDLLVTQRGLRHRSIQSTVIYTEIDDQEVATAADLIPDLRLRAA